ncbi:MAG: hypothetical protein JRG82_13180 [Deltaproteobacteria bacterium]|nr:hypothetical protein [Deltaproteobacteria bacterium]
MTGYRKGGSGYLALDVTDPSAVAGTHGPYPKLLWELDDPNEPFGESWSQMIITRVKVEGGVGSGDHCGADDGDGDCKEQWVGIIGAGYNRTGDPNLLSYIGDPNSVGWTNEGRGIYIINLEDGSVVSKFTYDRADAVASGLTDAVASTPAVLDLDFDGFADVVYVGDLGGWMWKWDLSTVGTDSADADSLIDSWPVGPFFQDDGQDLGAGANHWRSVFFPPSATMIDGELTLSFGSGERTNLPYPGVAGVDENNRFVVIQDPNPTGPGSIPTTPYTIADVTDVTATGIDTDPTDLGFFISARDGEKFVTDHITFQGFLITTTYAVEDTGDPCNAGGSSFVYIFDLATGAGFFGSDDSPEASDRSLSLGGGIPSSPAISVGENGATIFVSTSGGSVPSLEGPNEDESPVELVYWKQER